MIALFIIGILVFTGKLIHFACKAAWGNYEGRPLCNWNSRAADGAVCRRAGVSRDPPVGPCAGGGISLACFEGDVRI